MRASSKNGADDGERKEGATSLTAAFDAKTPFAKVGDGTNRDQGSNSCKDGHSKG